MRLFDIGFHVFYTGGRSPDNFTCAADKSDEIANKSMREIIQRIKNETNAGVKCIELTEFDQLLFTQNICRIAMVCKKI